MPIQLMLSLPNATDGTSFYRGAGPFAALRRAHPEDFSITILREFTWPVMGMIDAVFMQRACSEADFGCIQLARSNGVPVWLDYDDDLFSIPRDNPAFPIYGNEACRVAVAKCIQVADYVTVSTRRLAETFAPLRENRRPAEVIPNAFDDTRIAPPMECGAKDRKKIVLWRGSATHVRDLSCFAKQIIEASYKFRDWQFVFAGYHPWFIIEEMRPKSFVLAPEIDIIDYWAFLRELHPALMIVPLADNQFNHCKSNIAWLEGSYAGATCLVPPYPEWEQPGVIRYDCPTSFGNRLERAMRDWSAGVRILEEKPRAAWAHVQEELLLSKVNNRRWQVLLEVAQMRGKVRTYPTAVPAET